MCGRTSLFAETGVLQARFDADPHPDYSARYNIAPQDDLDVIAEPDAEQIDRFNWGIRPHWVDDPKDWSHPINARAETVAEKPSFRAAFEERRCLVIADGFYEWYGERGSKRPFRVERADDEPFAFAGIWEEWGENGDEFRSTAIITTEPNDVVEEIHDRMPVILEPDEEETWLESEDGEELQALLDPYPDDLTDAYEISTKVNNPDNDSAEVIEPLGHDQSGLGEYG